MNGFYKKIKNALDFLGKTTTIWLVVSVFSGAFLFIVDVFLGILIQQLVTILGISTIEVTILGITVPTLTQTSFLILFMITGIFRSAVNFLIYYSAAAINETIGKNLRLLLFNSLFLGNKVFYLSLSNIQYKLSEVFPNTAVFFLHLAQFIPQLFYAIALLLLLFISDVQTTLVGLGGILVIGIIIKTINKTVRIYADRRPQIYLKLSSHLVKAVKNFYLLKTFRMLNFELNTLTRLSNDYLYDGLKASFLAYAIGFIPQALGIVLIVVMIYFKLNHGILNSLEFLSYLYLYFRFIQNLGATSSSYGILTFHYSNMYKAFKFFKETQSIHEKTIKQNSIEIPKKVGVNKNPPAIHFKNVSYKYPLSKNFILNNFSFNLKPGEQLAIQGKSGSGKSTLLGILLGLIETNQGEVKINDLTPGDYFGDVNHSIGYVGADSFLIEGSLRDNLKYGNTAQLTDHEYLNALKLVKLEKWLNEVEGNPLEYALTENGEGLSTGQKQRIALARSLLRNPELLVLDELTANLDMETELEIAELLKSFKGTCTTIIVSHRAGILVHADHLVSLDT